LHAVDDLIPLQQKNLLESYTLSAQHLGKASPVILLIYLSWQQIFCVTSIAYVKQQTVSDGFLGVFKALTTPKQQILIELS
jgi:hypothetical protein